MSTPWNPKYSLDPESEIPKNVVFDMKGYVVILDTDFSDKTCSSIIVETKTFQDTFAKLLPREEKNLWTWFAANAWDEDETQPDDNPEIFRVSPTSLEIWKAIDKLAIGRLHWHIVFHNADYVFHGHYLSGGTLPGFCHKK